MNKFNTFNLKLTKAQGLHKVLFSRCLTEKGLNANLPCTLRDLWADEQSINDSHHDFDQNKAVNKDEEWASEETNEQTNKPTNESP